MSAWMAVDVVAFVGFKLLRYNRVSSRVNGNGARSVGRDDGKGLTIFQSKGLGRPATQWIFAETFYSTNVFASDGLNNATLKVSCFIVHVFVETVAEGRSMMWPVVLQGGVVGSFLGGIPDSVGLRESDDIWLVL